MQIGFVGLGAMGSGIAANLLASGHALRVFNRTAARTETLRNAGAAVATTPADATREADAVFTIVSDDAALRTVTLGDDGILSALRPGAVHVCMSTVGVATARELADLHRRAARRYVSAPIFGRPDAAATRKLFILAAGADADLEAVHPLLEVLGQGVRVVGSDPEQANLVKLIGNFMLTVVVETLGEACAAAAKASLDPGHLVELLTGTIFGAPAYRNYGPAIAAQRYQPAGFALTLAQKDNRLMLQAAEALGVPLPLASLVHDRFLAARAHGFGPEHDLAALAHSAYIDAGIARDA